MEEVAAVRRAALDAVDDVEPGPLHDRIQERLETGSLAPGVLAVLSARAAYDVSDDTEIDNAETDDFPVDAIAERGAGVQLIYEGLRLTRTLAQDPPWERGRSLTDGAGDTVKTANSTDSSDLAADIPDGDVSGADVEAADLTDADMAILVADIMVARGFYLLARTEAAGGAVSTVQSFGRDQTTHRTSGDASLDHNLEVDVFELATVAGTTAFGAETPEALKEYVSGLARTERPLPLADGIFTESTVDRLAGFLTPGVSDNVATSADS